MKLHEAQHNLQRLLDAHQRSGHARTNRACFQAVCLLTALLPILAWPEPSALRGDEDSLVRLDELIRRANITTSAFSNNAWEGMRRYLDWVPGLHMEPGSRQIVFSGNVARESVYEHHEYVLLQLR